MKKWVNTSKPNEKNRPNLFYILAFPLAGLNSFNKQVFYLFNKIYKLKPKTTNKVAKKLITNYQTST